MNYGSLIIDVADIALEASARHKHAAALLGDAAHFLAEGNPLSARVSLRVAERVLMAAGSDLAFDVSTALDELIAPPPALPPVQSMPKYIYRAPKQRPETRTVYQRAIALEEDAAFFGAEAVFS